MKKYYVNKQAQANGDHEVHNEDCWHIPKLENCEYLGRFNNCFDAVAEAIKTYPKANGCKHCSEECHTS